MMDDATFYKQIIRQTVGRAVGRTEGRTDGRMIKRANKLADIHENGAGSTHAIFRTLDYHKRFEY